jgi:hypothetical protein
MAASSKSSNHPTQKRYTEAFKKKIVKEVTSLKLSPYQARLKYNLGGATISFWIGRYAPEFVEQKAKAKALAAAKKKSLVKTPKKIVANTKKTTAKKVSATKKKISSKSIIHKKVK